MTEMAWRRANDTKVALAFLCRGAMAMFPQCPGWARLGNPGVDSAQIQFPPISRDKNLNTSTSSTSFIIILQFYIYPNSNTQISRVHIVHVKKLANSPQELAPHSLFASRCLSGIRTHQKMLLCVRNNSTACVRKLNSEHHHLVLPYLRGNEKDATRCGPTIMITWMVFLHDIYEN